MMKVIKLSNKTTRIVKGPLLEEVEIDWTQSLDLIQEQLQLSLGLYASSMKSLKKKKFKDMRIYQGGKHIDIIENGKGSLDVLFVEDHHS